MATEIYDLSTEYLYWGMRGTVPTSASVTFQAAGVKPADLVTGWHDAEIVTDTHALWDAAVQALIDAGKGNRFDYYLARKVGSGLANDYPLAVSDPDGYQSWYQAANASEIVVGETDTAVIVK